MSVLSWSTARRAPSKIDGKAINDHPNPKFLDDRSTGIYVSFVCVSSVRRNWPNLAHTPHNGESNQQQWTGKCLRNHVKIIRMELEYKKRRPQTCLGIKKMDNGLLEPPVKISTDLPLIVLSSFIYTNGESFFFNINLKPLNIEDSYVFLQFDNPHGVM